MMLFRNIAVIFVLTVMGIGCIPHAKAQQKNPFYPLKDDLVMPRPLGEVTKEPLCFILVNRAPYNIYGEVRTNFFIRDDGLKSRHRHSFKLDTDDSLDVCSRGPFFNGRRLEIQLKTLVPVFSCRTQATGTIEIQGERLEPIGTGTRSWIDCN